MADHPILEQANRIRYDLTAMQAKLSELLRMAAQLQAPDPAKHLCPTCGLTFKRTDKLAEHRYVTHDGPEPEHWLKAEKLAAPDTTRPSLPPRSGNVSTTNQIALLEDNAPEETNA